MARKRTMRGAWNAAFCGFLVLALTMSCAGCLWAAPSDGHGKGRRFVSEPERGLGHDYGEAKDRDHGSTDDALAAIVVAHGAGSADDWSMARGRGMTLEDFLLTTLIARAWGHDDFVTVFDRHRGGVPYKGICKASGVKWGWVRRHMKGQYQAMRTDALKAGLVMWALNRILN